jgi:uncharacterized protein (TIGR02246 family)
MRLHGMIVLWIAVALTGIACQPTAEDVGSLSDEDSAAIRNFFAEHVENALAGDWAADAALYTEDAVRLPPNGAPIRGRTAIEAALAGVDTVLSFAHNIVELDGRGDLAYVWVDYSFSGLLPNVDQPFTDMGKALILLRKQPDGSWMFSRVMWNANEAAGKTG